MTYSHDLSPEVTERARRIRLVAYDVDGVLTNGSLFFGDDGQEYKAFNSRDGHGIKMLHKHGFQSAIITGRVSDVVEHRAKNLGIDIIYQGQHDKTEALEDLLKNTGLDPDQVAYVGDDVVDLPVLCRVGLAIAVQDAAPLVLEHAHWVTPSNGGQGAARDVCEMLLQVNNLLEQELRSYLPA